jgi:hypothetical protein
MRRRVKPIIVTAAIAEDVKVGIHASEATAAPFHQPFGGLAAAGVAPQNVIRAIAVGFRQGAEPADWAPPLNIICKTAIVPFLKLRPAPPPAIADFFVRKLAST